MSEKKKDPDLRSQDRAASSSTVRLVLIFDFDGTICDSFEEVSRALNLFAKRYKYKELTPEDLHLIRGRGSQEAFQFIGISRYKLPFVVRDIRKHLSDHLDAVRPFPEIPPILSQLRKEGFTIGILTSNSEKNVRTFLDRENIPVDFVHAGSSIFGKGHVLKKLLKEKFAQVPPSQIYYIGDETRDIAAARHAGVQSAAVNWGFTKESVLKSLKPDVFLSQPKDLLNFVNLSAVKQKNPASSTSA